jgi:hypothetical protein
MQWMQAQSSNDNDTDNTRGALEGPNFNWGIR